MQTVRMLRIRGLEDSTYNVSEAQKVLWLNLRPAIDVMKAPVQILIQQCTCSNNLLAPHRIISGPLYSK
jgi:hypothetical protein